MFQGGCVLTQTHSHAHWGGVNPAAASHSTAHHTVTERVCVHQELAHVHWLESRTNCGWCWLQSSQSLQPDEQTHSGTALEGPNCAPSKREWQGGWERDSGSTQAIPVPRLNQPGHPRPLHQGRVYCMRSSDVVFLNSISFKNSSPQNPHMLSYLSTPEPLWGTLIPIITLADILRVMLIDYEEENKN